MPPPVPETRYARNGDLHIAYQVVGDGPIDLVLLSDWTLPLEFRWDEPAVARPLRRLASFTRLISFDKRGWGCSDPAPLQGDAVAEQWIDDLRVVLDAVDARRPALMATADGGPVGVLFAATFPERVSALVLSGTTACALRAEGYDIGIPPRLAEQFLAALPDDWASAPEEWGPDAIGVRYIPDNERLRAWWNRCRRVQASPSTAQEILRAFMSIDVRHVLRSIQAPTLVLHGRDATAVRPVHGRYLADHIPGAKYVELAGSDVWWGSKPDGYIDEIEEFLTGVRPAAEPDRVLATVLFTDIVGSTERASELGDRRWRELLERHDDVVRQELERHRGREIKVVGDEFVATFDGPARAIRCACAITDAVRTLGLEVRAGLHTGEIELRGDDIAGVAVHIGARVGALAGPGEVLVSGAVPPLVAGSGLEFDDRGAQELKGVSGEWRIFAVCR